VEHKVLKVKMEIQDQQESAVHKDQQVQILRFPVLRVLQVLQAQQVRQVRTQLFPVLLVRLVQQEQQAQPVHKVFKVSREIPVRLEPQVHRDLKAIPEMQVQLEQLEQLEHKVSKAIQVQRARQARPVQLVKVYLLAVLQDKSYPRSMQPITTLNG
jgi:hypothetical protein